jgi:hypothetical protein
MRVVLRTMVSSATIALLAATYCSTPKQSGSSGDTTQRNAGANSSSDTVAARAKVAQLESDARALAKTSGCSSASQCRTAPIGAKACGGPRTYVAYCAATTDSVALYRKLGELSAAEKEYNKSTGMMSTCEFRLPPAVSLQGGSCRANSP